MGDARYLTTPQSLLPSAATPHLPLRNAGASAGGSPSLPPPGPAPPESRPATSVTVLSVMSTGTSSGGWSGYVSRLAADGGRASGCLVQSTYITLSPVLVHISDGCSNPPPSHAL